MASLHFKGLVASTARARKSPRTSRTGEFNAEEGVGLGGKQERSSRPRRAPGVFVW